MDFVICVELIIYLLLDNLDDCIFKHWQTTQPGHGKKVICIRVTQKLPLVFTVYLFFITFPSEKYLKIDNKEITIQFLSVFLSRYIMFLSFANKIHFLITISSCLCHKSSSHRKSFIKRPATLLNRWSQANFAKFLRAPFYRTTRGDYSMIPVHELTFVLPV